MTIETKITCDHCKKDLTYSSGGVDSSLVLTNRNYGPNSAVVLDYLINDLLQEDHHFCGFGCLKKWIEEIS